MIELNDLSAALDRVRNGESIRSVAGGKNALAKRIGKECRRLEIKPAARPGPKLPDDLTETIRDLAPHYSARKIASMTGVSGPTIIATAKAAGITLLDRATAYRLAMKDVPNSAGAIAARKRQTIPIPKWCPEEFRSEYQEMGVILGEEGAASHVRRLLAEMRAAA